MTTDRLAEEPFLCDRSMTCPHRVPHAHTERGEVISLTQPAEEEKQRRYDERIGRIRAYAATPQPAEEEGHGGSRA